MTDPRVERTRLHVLETARRMLSERNGEPLTFTTLAAEARVSRRTLYTHWGSIDRVFSDAVTLLAADETEDLSALSPRDRLRAFLRGVRDGIHEPVTTVALASLLNQATHNAEAAQSLVAMGEARIASFARSVGPVTDAQWVQLVGPIFAAEFMMRQPASDELLDELVDRGAELLRLG